jgi:hypothetical protein
MENEKKIEKIVPLPQTIEWFRDYYYKHKSKIGRTRKYSKKNKIMPIVFSEGKVTISFD